METKFYTVGVYGFEAEEFFDKLLENGIDTFVDIRRRRAVRGSKFAFVNSTRLQSELARLGIKYIHLLELAPTNEIRDMQKKADAMSKTSKREREELGAVFVKEYNEQILKHYNLEDMIKRLEELGSKKAVLFCVEKYYKACHRSLVAAELENEFNIVVNHL